MYMLIATSFKAAKAAAKHAAGGQRHSLIPHWLTHLGGLGLFAVAILDSSPIPLPIPGSTDLLLLLLVSHRGNPFLLAFLAILGSAIGGYITWSAGKKGGEALMERSLPQRFRERLQHVAKKHSVLSVVVAALLPPPIPLTPFLLAAGALGVSRNRFLAAFASARTVRYALIAWAAETYGRVVVQWWTRKLAGWSSVILWTFVVLLAGSILFGIWRYRRQSRPETEERAFA
jgi:membrane protein YqaA with SNARE-associated domain